MPKNNKGGFKPAKNYDPNRGKSAPGNRSPKHRGFRPEEDAPKKNRWDADARAERSGVPQGNRFGGGPAREDRGGSQRREGFAPRDDFRGNRSGGSQGRDDRGFAGREDRGGSQRREGFAPRDDFRGNRSGGYQGRDERSGGPGREDRGGYQKREGGFQKRDGGFSGNRSGGFQKRDDARAEGGRGFAPRDDRPGYQKRDDRPGYQKRDEARGERSGGFAPREDRGSFRSEPGSAERPGRRYFDESGQERTGGKRVDRPERPARAERFERPERPARAEFAPRPERAERSDRGNRPERFDRGGQFERPERGHRPERGFREDRARRDTREPSRGFRDDKPRYSPAEDVVLERLVAQATSSDEHDGKSFAELGLGQNLVRTLAELGAESPFPIQSATIPDVLAGSDVLGRGRTGSGKTIAFGAPLVERLLKLKAEGAFAADDYEEPRPVRGERRRRFPAGRKPKALIMAPTRELALQIDRTVQPLARAVGLFTTQIYGGVPQQRQVGALERGVDIIIGTPGRIEDLIEQGRLDLSEIVISVLDEADHMCDLGFLEPVQRILRRTKHHGQKLLFSATLDQGVAKLVKEFLRDPAVREIAGEDQASGTIDHKVLVVNREDKDQLIEQLVDRDGKTLVFSRTRAYAERLTELLEDAGIPAVSLHGDLNQARRTRNLEKLTKGRVNVLVATDVAARGIHVDDIDLVVQADPPEEYKTYLHRAGRTGRAGKEGTVVTIIPRNRQRRTQELFERAEITPSFFAEFFPGDQLR